MWFGKSMNERIAICMIFPTDVNAYWKFRFASLVIMYGEEIVMKLLPLYMNVANLIIFIR